MKAEYGDGINVELMTIFGVIVLLACCAFVSAKPSEFFVLAGQGLGQNAFGSSNYDGYLNLFPNTQSNTGILMTGQWLLLRGGSSGIKLASKAYTSHVYPSQTLTWSLGERDAIYLDLWAQTLHDDKNTITVSDIVKLRERVTELEKKLALCKVY